MMCDGYAFILSVFYWRGDGKTMFSPILEVTTIQDGGALGKKVYILTKPGRAPQEAAAEMEKVEQQTTDERRAT